MDRNLQHRLSKIEKLVSTALKERKEKERRAKKETVRINIWHARYHATAVAAIVLAGQPKIDEPLIRAWKRALQYYGINVNELGQLDDQVKVAQQLLPIIMKGEELPARFAEIFKTAPIWLLQFTGTAWDAHLLEFHLPDMKKLRWGIAGYEEARQWPLLPSGTITAGDPIPDPDIEGRWIWLGYYCIATPFIPNFVDELFRAEEKNPIHLYSDPILEEMNFILDLDGKPEEQRTRHEKRRVRKFSERWALDRLVDEFYTDGDH